MHGPWSATWVPNVPPAPCFSWEHFGGCSPGLGLSFYYFKTLAAHNSSRDQPLHPDPPPPPQSFGTDELRVTWSFQPVLLLLRTEDTSWLCVVGAFAEVTLVFGAKTSSRNARGMSQV